MYDDIYDCPIHEQIGAVKGLMADEHDRQLLKIIQEVAIEIDRDSLIQAIHNDRQRYEEAYWKGYLDCQKKYVKVIEEFTENFEDISQQIVNSIRKLNTPEEKERND